MVSRPETTLDRLTNVSRFPTSKWHERERPNGRSFTRKLDGIDNRENRAIEMVLRKTDCTSCNNLLLVSSATGFVKNRKAVFLEQSNEFVSETQSCTNRNMLRSTVSAKTRQVEFSLA